MSNDEILLKASEKENELIKENYKRELNISKENESKYRKLEEEYQSIKLDNIKLKEKLEAISNSRSYRFAQKIKKIMKK